MNFAFKPTIQAFTVEEWGLLRVFIRRLFFVFAWLICSVSYGAAQDVTLAPLNDDALRITGTLLGFDGDYYRVSSQYGEVTIDATSVTCTGPGCPSLTNFISDITIAGAATIGEILMPALLQAFARKEGLAVRRIPKEDGQFDLYLQDRQNEKDVAVFRFDIVETDVGFSALLSNRADIVMALRAIRPHETEVLEDAGFGNLEGPNRARVLALDALVPMVAPQSHVTSISLETIGAILAGDITNWRDLGGPDSDITIHLRNPESGLAQGAMDRILAPMGKTLAAEVVRHRTDAALDAAVSADPSAIGLGSHAQVRDARIPALQSACGFAQTANRTSIKSEDYPLAAPLLLYIPQRRLPGLARDFLAFTRSPGAQIVIRRAGLVDQAPESLPFALQGDRLANAIAVAENLSDLQSLRQNLARRLRITTSFRFSDDGQTLNTTSMSNVQQLARALEHGDFDEKRLLIAGFGNESSPGTGSGLSSIQQAQAVKDALQNAVGMRSDVLDAAEVMGFGSQMPLACDTTPMNRHVNRRVEIWID